MKRRSSLLLFLGIGLILISLCLALFFGIQSHLGNQKSQATLAKLTQLLPDRTQGVPDTCPDAVMPVLGIDGVDYVAILEIPAFNITLPVADQWDSSKLSQAPAHFWGSAYDGTLVIGGADHPRQFGFCDQIDLGTPVTITDMAGAQFSYTVSGVDRGSHAETQWLTEADCDLTLFCRDMYSMEYIAVRCVSSCG